MAKGTVSLMVKRKNPAALAQDKFTLFGLLFFLEFVAKSESGLFLPSPLSPRVFFSGGEREAREGEGAEKAFAFSFPPLTTYMHLVVQRYYSFSLSVRQWRTQGREELGSSASFAFISRAAAALSD